MLRSKLLIPAVLLAALASGAASAEPLRVSPGYSADPAIAVAETRLAYTDADLATAAGARAMLGRITAAAEAVCGQAQTAAQRAEVADCRERAISGAVARLGHPSVRELASRRMAEQAAW
ncbi:MAG: UrcA family protein [Proteobacteria bacterium]|nr:UrcA family protein [Pseudomonadota bacterium]